MKRALVILLAVLALPLLGAPAIRNGGEGPGFWSSLWAVVSGRPNTYAGSPSGVGR